MKNKKTKKTQIALISLIALAFLFLPKLPIQAASNDILVFALYPEYINITDKIEKDGFNIKIINRSKIDKITDLQLSDYGQIWIIGDAGIENAIGYSFENDEIKAIKEFHENGGGLLISTDANRFQGEVNPIAKEFNNGADLFYGHTPTLSEGPDRFMPEFTWTGYETIHPIWQNMTEVYSGGHDSKLNIQPSSNIEVTAKFNGADYGAVLDDGKGRVVFDICHGRFRLLEQSTSIYQLNIANWLGEGKKMPSCEITASSTSINSGDSVILIWSSKNANSIVSSNNLNSTQELSGNITKKPTSATTYKLTVASSSGEQAICEVTVNIKKPPAVQKPLPIISGPCQNLVPCKNDCKLSDIFVMIKNIVNCLVAISTIICLLFLVIGGLLYIFSLGNPENLTKAKNTILWALGGLALVFLAWLIVNTIMLFMGVGGGFLMWSSVG